MKLPSYVRKSPWMMAIIMLFILLTNAEKPSVQPSVIPTISVAVTTAPTATESATVKRVIDGDTIELTDGHKLRYIGMDTPELGGKEPQCYAAESYRRNKELVEDQTIVLEKDVSNVDRYGRLLRYVWVNGIFVNEQLVREGYAMARSYPPDIKHQAILREAEASARESKAGFWGTECSGSLLNSR